MSKTATARHGNHGTASRQNHGIPCTERAVATAYTTARHGITAHYGRGHGSHGNEV